MVGLPAKYQENIVVAVVAVVAVVDDAPVLNDALC